MIETLSLQTSLLQTLGWTLLHSLWQGALIAALLFFVLLFVKRSQIRYVVSCVALLLMILVPVVTFGMLFDKPTVSTETDVVSDVPLHNQPLDVDTSVNVDALQPFPQGGQPHGVAPTRVGTDERFWRQRLTDYLPYVVVAWLSGVVLLSLRLLLHWLYAERFKRRHTNQASLDLQQLLRVLALRLCVSRPVQLLESTLVDAPTVIGFLKPVILLPTSALTGLTMQQLESLLAHELAHIRRHDYLVNILQSMIETLLFYHPAVWWVSRRVRIEREHCCDDVAVHVSGSAVVYAKALATLETLRHQPKLALAASDGKLVNRIKRVLGKPERSPNWLASVLILPIIAALVFFVNFPDVEAQTNPKNQKQIWVSAIGAIAFRDDTLESAYIGPEGTYPKSYILIEEQEGSNSKKLKITQSPEGELVYAYSINDKEELIDEEVMRWYREIWLLIENVSKTGEFGDNWTVLWSQSDAVGEEEGRNLWVENLYNAFGHKNDSSTLISYIKDPLSGFPNLLSSIQVSYDDTNWIRLIDEPEFSAYRNIIQAHHALEHIYFDGGKIGADRAIKLYVEDLLENVPLTTRDMEAILPLIQAVKTPETKKELLLKFLGKISSMNELGLEQSISFAPPFDNAEVTAKFGELGSNSISLRAPVIEAPVKAITDGVVLNASLLSSNDGYIVSIEHAIGFITTYMNLQSIDLPVEGQAIKQGDVIGYLGGGSIEPKDVLKLYVRNDVAQFVDPLQFLPELLSSLESNRVYELPYLVLPHSQLIIEAPKPDTREDIIFYVDENTREIPFTFNPKNLGILETLEQPYKLRLTIQDDRGKRELINREVSAAEVVTATLEVYGEATAELFINDVLFMGWNP